MAKTNIKVDLSSPKQVNLFYLGISSSAGIAILAHSLNLHLDIQLSFMEKMMAIQNDIVIDSMPIFTTFEPKKDELKLESYQFNLDNILDLNLPTESTETKYLLIQTKGEKINLFPKINPMDYLFISNYHLDNHREIIQSIPAVTIQYELMGIHIGKRYDYFRKLFYN